MEPISRASSIPFPVTYFYVVAIVAITVVVLKAFRSWHLYDDYDSAKLSAIVLLICMLVPLRLSRNKTESFDRAAMQLGIIGYLCVILALQLAKH
jgi:hypothetical protein